MDAGQRILGKIIPQRWSRLKLADLRFSIAQLQALRYRQFVIILVITVIAYELVGVFYKGIGLSLIRTKVNTAVVEREMVGEPSKMEPIDSYRVITEQNLFGSTDKTIAEKQLSAGKAAPEPDITTLFELRGTVAGDAKYGFAVIEEKSRKKQGLYKVGDTVAGARVTKITRNSVSLVTGKEEKILKMAETREAPILPPGSGTGERVAQQPGGSGLIVISRSDIGEGLKDMGSMLSQAQIRPYFSMGVPDGFLVTSIRQGSIYQKLGVTDGDIIQGMNDRRMKTADDMLELYNMIKSGSGMSLTVKRQGRQETFNYVFR